MLCLVVNLDQALVHHVKNYDSIDKLHDLSLNLFGYESIYLFLFGFQCQRIFPCHWIVGNNNNDSGIYVLTKDMNLSGAQNEAHQL